VENEGEGREVEKMIDEGRGRKGEKLIIAKQLNVPIKTAGGTTQRGR